MWAVIYRSGGWADCRWTRLNTAFPTELQAVAKTAELERAGYRARAVQSRKLDTLGLPIGWMASLVDWERDEIHTSNHETRHRMHPDNIKRHEASRDKS